MLHRQFLAELAQRRRRSIRKRLDPGWKDAGLDLLAAVNQLTDVLEGADPPMEAIERAELLDYTEASIRRLERLRYRLSCRQGHR